LGFASCISLSWIITICVLILSRLLHSSWGQVHSWLLQLSSSPYRTQTISKYYWICFWLGTSFCHMLVDISGHLCCVHKKKWKGEGGGREGTQKPPRDRRKSRLFISGFLSCLLSAFLRYVTPFTAAPTITEEAFN
jgi:hypothetical protein